MEHAVEAASSCSSSHYVECTCGEKFWAGTAQEAAEKHTAHAAQGDR